MNRRALLLSGAVALSALGGWVSAGSLPVVGVLVTDIRRNATFRQFSDALREMGYVEGRDVTYRVVSAEGDSSKLPALAAGMVRSGIDVLFASGPAAIRAARSATSTLPIVALDLETDPVAAGWVASLARPGGNLTGLFLDLPSFVGKWLEILKEIDPGLRKVVLIWDSAAGSTQLPAAEAAATRLGMEADLQEVRTVAEVDGVLARSERAGVRGVVFLSSPTISQESPALARIVSARRMMGISPFRLFPESGGLVSYGPRFDDFRRRGAFFVARILKGAKAADLPIEQPTKFELVVNLKAARTLGLTLPQSVLLRADEVVR